MLSASDACYCGIRSLGPIAASAVLRPRVAMDRLRSDRRCRSGRAQSAVKADRTGLARLPDAPTRLKIIERYVRGFDIKTGAIRVLTWLTDGYSGSEIETLCDFITRHMTLNAKDNPSVMAAVQLFLDLSASNCKNPIREALQHDEAHWFQQALDYRDIKIVQSDLGEATNMTQPSVRLCCSPGTGPSPRAWCHPLASTRSGQ